MEKETSISTNKLQEAISSTNEVLSILNEAYLKDEEDEKRIWIEKQILDAYRNNIFVIGNDGLVSMNRRIELGIFIALPAGERDKATNMYNSLPAGKKTDAIIEYVRPLLHDLVSKATIELCKQTGFSFLYTDMDIRIKTTNENPSGYPGRGDYLDTFNSHLFITVDVQ